jgi:hypothetical protein
MNTQVCFLNLEKRREWPKKWQKNK